MNKPDVAWIDRQIDIDNKFKYNAEIIDHTD